MLELIQLLSTISAIIAIGRLIYSFLKYLIEKKGLILSKSIVLEKMLFRALFLGKALQKN